MVANCPDLCTAEKCRELETRIEQLEQAITALNDLIDNHLELDIPFAHDYNPRDIDPSDYIPEIDLSNYVTKTEFNNHTATNIPNAHNYVPSINVDIFPQEDGNNILKIQVDGQSDEDTFKIPTYNLDDISLKIFNNNNGEIRILFSIDGRDISDIIDISDLYARINLQDSVVQISGFYENNGIFLSVASAGGVDTSFIDLPFFDGGGSNQGELEIPPISVSINSDFNSETSELTINTVVSGASASTTVVLPLEEMDLSEVLDYLNQISAAVNTEITGQYEIGQTDVSLIGENGDRRIGYAEYKTLDSQDEGFIDTQYLGTGFEGVNQAFIALDKKITNLHKDLARAIDPELSIETIAPADCYDGVTRDDYTDEEWEALPAEVKQHIEKDLGDKFRDFVSNNPVLSDFAEPLLRSLGSLAFKLPSIPAFFAVNFTSNLLVHQFREDTTPISCKYVPNTVEPEYIAIVANPEVRPNIKDTILILEFTTVEAFPKLNETRSKWRVQIPAPKSNITWDNLNSIRWKRGELYARLKFEERINCVAGWFENKESAESYFNQIIELTTLTLQTMSFSERTNPRIRPAQIETRVYRAFTVFIGENGEPNNSLTQALKPPPNAV